jgi:hypothetical protein
MGHISIRCGSWRDTVTWREVGENCALLGCYVASGGSSLPTFRENLSVQSSSVRNSWPSKTGPICVPKSRLGITTNRSVITQKSAVLALTRHAEFAIQTDHKNTWRCCLCDVRGIALRNPTEAVKCPDNLWGPGTLLFDGYRWGRGSKASRVCCNAYHLRMSGCMPPLYQMSAWPAQ